MDFVTSALLGGAFTTLLSRQLNQQLRTLRPHWIIWQARDNVAAAIAKELDNESSKRPIKEQLAAVIEANTQLMNIINELLLSQSKSSTPANGGGDAFYGDKLRTTRLS